MDNKDSNSSKYSYGEIGDKIINACSDYPPDFEEIIELMNTGFDLNTLVKEDDEDNMLSDIIYGYPVTVWLRQINCEKCTRETCEGCIINYPEADGRYLPHMVKLFLEHGFDCSRDNGRAGAVCLSNLIFSSRDKYILDAAKLLLEAGADPNYIIFDDTNDSVIEYVREESGYVLMTYDDEDGVNEYELSNLLYTLYEIMDACVSKDSFSDIYNYDKALGKKIDQIILYGEKEKAKSGFSDFLPTPMAKVFAGKRGKRQGIFSYGEHENCFFDHIVFWCEGVPLCIDTFGNIFVNPRAPQKAKSAENIEKYFPDCVGHKIEKIELGRFEINKGEKIHNERLIRIHLDKGKIILFPIVFRKKINEQYYSYFDVV